MSVTYPVAAQNPADGGIADAIAQSYQLAVHSPISPSWVLSCQPQDQVANLAVERWPSGPMGLAPLAGQKLAVPGQQGGWGDHAVEPEPGWQHPGECGEDRAV